MKLDSFVPGAAKAFGSLVFGAGLLLSMGTSCTPKPEGPAPRISQFGVDLARVCINAGLPIVRVSWAVQGGSTQSCMSNLTINGAVVNGDIWDTGIQGGRCGNGDYTRETAFSLRDFFGNNIPSSITIAGQLTKQVQVGVFVGSDVLDTASATLTSETCEFEVAPR